MITKRRMFYASLAAAAAFFVVPAIATCYEMQNLSADGTDDAFVRSAGLMLLYSPFIFIFVAVLIFYVAVLLEELKQLKPTGIAVTVAAVSFGLGSLMALERLFPFGWRDALYYYFGSSGYMFATLSFSAIVWWIVARPNSGERPHTVVRGM